MQLILAPYPGKGWRVAATGKVDKLEHEDLWALNLDMGNWNNEAWHDLKNKLLCRLRGVLSAKAEQPPPVAKSEYYRDIWSY